MACVEWWRTIETLVAALVLVAQRERKLGLRDVDFGSRRPTNDDTFRDRWLALPSFFASSDEEAHKPPERLTNRVDDLRRFRNSYEHSGGATLARPNHTRLAPEPRIANVADAFEAMSICVEAANYVRHVLPSCDLMPSVLVPVADPQWVFHEKLDTLAGDLLFPAFHEVLAARGLRSEVRLASELEIPCTNRAQLVVAFAIKHDAEDPVAQPFACLRDRGEQYQDAHPRRPSVDTFGLPDYSTAN